MSLQDELREADTRPKSPPSPAGSDDEKDNDTFEDAIDASSVRSLTNRNRGPSKHDSTSTHDRANTPDSSNKPKTKGKDDSSDEEEESEEEEEEEEEEEDDEEEEEEEEEDSFEGVDIDSRSDNGTVKDPKRSSKVSASTMDNVDLDGVPPPAPPKPFAEKTSPVPAADAEAAVPAKQPTKKLSLSNITASLPAMPWSPPPTETNTKGVPAGAAPSATNGPTPPAAPSRKFTSPFSWMSRTSTSKEPAVSPPTGLISQRRNTASSVTTLTSNPEMMLGKLEEEEGDNGSNAPRQRNSLRDRFKMVRMREEAGISMAVGDEDPNAGLASHRGSLATIDPTSPQAEPGTDATLALQPPKSPMPQSPNPSLAPGTVSGVTAGPSSIGDSQVDWDFWQAVVYEGPAAVAKSSAEELNRAIATGIPTVIRGVVWQVLAQSKNEDLEVVYKELSTRGMEKRNSNGTAASIASSGTLNVDKETVTSSASSVHSEVSGASGVRSPATSAESAEAVASMQAAAKKKQQEDAVALSKLEKVIKRDMGTRTSYSKHAVASGLQEGLFGVCKAYALFDEGVGYAQGMNFLIMPLLFNMPEEEAFCILVKLMNQYKLRDLFIEDMPGLHMRLYQFERLLEDFEPALYCHLRRRGITPHLYATQWFLTLFAYRFPLQLVLRIYDLIFSEGLSAILKFGIVLMQKNSATLLGMSDMAQLTTFLKDKIFDVYIDHSPSAGSILENGFFGSSSSNIDKEVYRADELVRDACEVKITPEMLKAYTVEWEDKTRAEKEKEQELEQLRSTNISQAIRIRKLEERLQVSDHEAAEMATDLVQTKVRNEELNDINESLTGQVKELRIVIEKQPEEIEQAWQLERDDLMKRNQAVHEENTKVEKEMAELEERLVETKMKYAEINAAHETLQKKWQELRRQFN